MSLTHDQFNHAHKILCDMLPEVGPERLHSALGYINDHVIDPAMGEAKFNAALEEAERIEAEWTPPQYKWLFTTVTPNGLHFFRIFDTREAAVEHCDMFLDIEPHFWFEDSSGDLSFYPENSEWSGYHYWITQEFYHGA